MAPAAETRFLDLLDKGRPGEGLRLRWPDRFQGMIASGWQLARPQRIDAALASYSACSRTLEAFQSDSDRPIAAAHRPAAAFRRVDGRRHEFSTSRVLAHTASSFPGLSAPAVSAA